MVDRSTIAAIQVQWHDPGFKETRGDNVHKHHWFHNRPDHCINLAIHCRWNAHADNDNYRRTKPMHILMWKKTIYHILRNIGHNGSAYSCIYYRWDISSDFNPSSVQWTGTIGHEVDTIHGQAPGCLDNGRLASH
eukprot:2695635-Amphidinium_carterae.2